MIVVAIIGILAAVAIPGFMAYISKSKTTEANTNLKSIGDGALAYFEAEHALDAAGMVLKTKVYPGCQDPGTIVAAGTLTACAGTEAPIGTLPSQASIGVKTSPTDTTVVANLKKNPWHDLNFSVSKPFYFYYQYISTQEATGSTFSAVAGACLTSCDEIKGDVKYSADAVFSIAGDANGHTGNIIEGGTIAVAKKP